MAFDISNINSKWFSAGREAYHAVRYRKRDVKNFSFSNDGEDILSIVFYDGHQIDVVLTELTIESSAPATVSEAESLLDVIIGESSSSIPLPPALLDEYTDSADAMDDGKVVGEYFRTGENVKQVIPEVLP